MGFDQSLISDDLCSRRSKVKAAIDKVARVLLDCANISVHKVVGEFRIDHLFLLQLLSPSHS
jgi:hypothetical protein